VQRVKKLPDVIANITFFKKKRKTNVKPTQLWTAMEDQVFLKYCPDPRVALYHVMADDTSGRPHELLAKRIGDVKVIKTNNSTNAEMEIGRGGKTRPRIVPLMKSLPLQPIFMAIVFSHFKLLTCISEELDRRDNPSMNQSEPESTRIPPPAHVPYEGEGHLIRAPFFCRIFGCCRMVVAFGCFHGFTKFKEP
jgi:hypothetical protein